MDGKRQRQKRFREFGASVQDLHDNISQAPTLFGPVRLLGKQGAGWVAPGKLFNKEFIEGCAGFKVSLRSLRGQPFQFSCFPQEKGPIKSFFQGVRLPTSRCAVASRNVASR
jgi:hypothetical protein